MSNVTPIERSPSGGAEAKKLPLPVIEPGGELDLNDPSLYLNRELTWLEFNRRVLFEATDKTNPLLEQYALLGVLPLGVFTQKLRVILERELHSPETPLDFSVYGSEITPNHVGHDIDVRRDALVPYDRRSRHDTHVGNIAQTHVVAICLFDP